MPNDTLVAHRPRSSVTISPRWLEGRFQAHLQRLAPLVPGRHVDHGLLARRRFLFVGLAALARRNVGEEVVRTRLELLANGCRKAGVIGPEALVGWLALVAALDDAATRCRDGTPQIRDRAYVVGRRLVTEHLMVG